MDKVEFANEIAKKIGEQHEDLVTDVHPEVIKNNGVKLVGLSIHKKGVNIAPTIYIDSMFHEGLSVDEAISKIMDIYDEHKGNMTNFDVNTITDFNKAKDNIVAKVINKSRNEHIMDSCPYAQFGDMIITFAVQVSQNEQGIASVKVTNELMNGWKVNLSDLIAIAYQNTKRMYKMEIAEMQNLLYQMMQRVDSGIDKEILDSMQVDNIMYVVTSTTRQNGSFYLADRESLIEIAQHIQSNEFYILPSSIHEFIVIPSNKVNQNTDELLTMVKEVNATQLATDEILADNVYIFNAQTEELRTIDGSIIPFVA